MINETISNPGSDDGERGLFLESDHWQERKKREIANSNERRRMRTINSGFEALRNLLPIKYGIDRLSKANILQTAVDLIKSLQFENRQLKNERHPEGKDDYNNANNNNPCPDFSEKTEDCFYFFCTSSHGLPCTNTSDYSTTPYSSTLSLCSTSSISTTKSAINNDNVSGDEGVYLSSPEHQYTLENVIPRASGMLRMNQQATVHSPEISLVERCTNEKEEENTRRESFSTQTNLLSSSYGSVVAIKRKSVVNDGEVATKKTRLIERIDPSNSFRCHEKNEETPSNDNNPSQRSSSSPLIHFKNGHRTTNIKSLDTIFAAIQHLEGESYSFP